MTLIIAVDAITDELQHSVSYLNFHTTDVTFLAFELQRAAGEGVDVLLPETYGEESAREKERSGAHRQCLDRETLLASIRKQSELAAHAADGILDWADGEPRLTVRYTPSLASVSGLRASRSSKYENRAPQSAT
jgi:hypothetical protein